MVVVEGKKFLDLSAACKYYGKNRLRVLSQLDKNVPLEVALGIYPENSKDKKFSMAKKKVIVGGLRFDNLGQACKYYGKNYSVIWSKVEKGFSLDEAFGFKKIKKVTKVEKVEKPKAEVAKRNKRPRKVEINGVLFKSVKSACEYTGVCYSSVLKKLNKGYPAEKAFGIRGCKIIDD